MQDHPVLAHVALGYSPMIDRQRAVVATRLSVLPESSDAAPDPAALLAALAEVWPDNNDSADAPLSLALSPRPLTGAAAQPGTPVRRIGEAGRAHPPVSLNLAGEALLRETLRSAAGRDLMIEVPAFMVGDPAQIPALRELQAAGTVLLIKGRPLTPLPPEVLALFSHSIVEAGDDRRSAAPAPTERRVSTVQAGARTSAEIEAAFARGAVAVLGWPLDDDAPRPSGRAAVASDVNVVMELIQGVNRELPVGKLEDILRRDPTVAFRLMRYLNSAAFGFSSEVSSLSHAIMLLGYQKLKRWLTVLLASAAKGVNAQPLIYAAVRRGLLMEELAREQGDVEMRSEMFMCGVFSLLDRLLQQSFSELVKSVPLPDRVQQSLLGDGPYEPYLELVRAIEQESLYDVRDITQRLLLSPKAVNRAVLTALHSARQLDTSR
ncbi:MAG: HDOD domain-containing protein [Rubrivivax sp.]